MITATCKNPACSQSQVAVYFLGQPDKVECGTCVSLCELSDPQQDPTEQETSDETPVADA
jgi:hypothetical protein